MHDIKFVINYDYPNSSEDYIHRIGRTGRRDQKGTAYSFFTSGDNAKAADLVKVLQEANQNIPEELEIIAFMRDGRGRGNGRKRDWNSGNENSYGGRGRGGGSRGRGNSERGKFDGFGGGESKRIRYDDEGEASPYKSNNSRGSRNFRGGRGGGYSGNSGRSDSRW